MRDAALVEFCICDVYILLMSKLCTNCHYIGNERAEVSGSFLLELILWGIAGATFLAGFMLFFVWIFALVFFAVAVFYSVRRAKTVKACPECGQNSMIPVHTPRAQEIITASGLTIPKMESSSPKSWDSVLPPYGRDFTTSELALLSLLALFFVMVIAYNLTF